MAVGQGQKGVLRGGCRVGVQTQSESAVPLLINCWPSASGAESYVNIEYESTVSFDLHNVVITIPIPSSGAAPRINQVPRPAATAPAPSVVVSRAREREREVLHPCFKPSVGLSDGTWCSVVVVASPPKDLNAEHKRSGTTQRMHTMSCCVSEVWNPMCTI